MAHSTQPWSSGPDTPFITLAALGASLGLLVGVVIRRTAWLPGRWAVLPMFLALTAIPLVAFSVVLQRRSTSGCLSCRPC